MKPTPLTEHPEGGRFREVFKSGSTVSSKDGRTRSAITHIYFSLDNLEVSRFHLVASDEVWNLYKGQGLRLYQWDDASNQLDVIELSSKAEVYCHVVPANIWQAAEPIGESVLVGCSVGPGFEFADFTLINPDSDTAKRMKIADPELSRFIIPSE